MDAADVAIVRAQVERGREIEKRMTKGSKTNGEFRFGPLESGEAQLSGVDSRPGQTLWCCFFCLHDVSSLCSFLNYRHRHLQRLQCYRYVVCSSPRGQFQLPLLPLSAPAASPQPLPSLKSHFHHAPQSKNRTSQKPSSKAQDPEAKRSTRHPQQYN